MPRLTMSSWYEPDYSAEDEVGEHPVLLSALVRVTGLEIGSSYALLRYDDPNAVPRRGFLAAAGYVEKHQFVAVEETYTRDTTFMSNSTQLFRCVRA